MRVHAHACVHARVCACMHVCACVCVLFVGMCVCVDGVGGVCVRVCVSVSVDVKCFGLPTHYTNPLYSYCYYYLQLFPRSALPGTAASGR